MRTWMQSLESFVRSFDHSQSDSFSYPVDHRRRRHAVETEQTLALHHVGNDVFLNIPSMVPDAHARNAKASHHVLVRCVPDVPADLLVVFALCGRSLNFVDSSHDAFNATGQID
jgi:hypothetical protein